MASAPESHEDIAKRILADTTAISLITSKSACSVIFKCMTSSFGNFCMKVSFVRPVSDVEGLVVNYTENMSKQTTTITEAEKTRERQHQMCSELQAYNDTLTFIPDAVGSCTLTPDIFQHYLMPTSVSDQRRVVTKEAEVHIKLIVTAAKSSNLGIHVLFMDLLQGVRGYNPVTDIQHTPYIVAAILAVTIVTGVASQDTHPDNVQISVSDEKVNVLKLIDWDRSICIYDEADRNKIVDWIGVVMDKNIIVFPLVCRFFLDETLKGMLTVITTPKLWNENKNKIKQKLIENFNTYYTDLSLRIINIKSNGHLIGEDQIRYDIFDLLTFIGFMDCLSKVARNPLMNLMRFSPFIYHLFNIDDIKILKYEMISLEDLVIFRQTYLESLHQAVSSKRSKPNPDPDPEVERVERVERVKSRLDVIIVELNGFLRRRIHSGRGGRPGYFKRRHRKTIKKQHRNKNNQKSIKRTYRRSKIRKRNTRN